MSKIESADLFECRYYSSELALLNEQLKSLQQQEQNIRLTEALLMYQREELTQKHKNLQEKLQELGDMLEQKYGIEHQNQVNWETGEILTSTPEAAAGPADYRLTTNRYVSPRVSSSAVDPGEAPGSEASGETGTEATDRGRAEDTGSPVE